MLNPQSASFGSADDDNRENKERYLRDWTQCLGALLGWPKDQVYRWSKKWEDGLEAHDEGMFYHEAPMYYITPLLISPSLSAKLSFPEWVRLDERLFEAIRHPGSFTPYGEEPEDEGTFDWQAAKRRVEAVLNEYGESLEPIQYPFMVERPLS